MAKRPAKKAAKPAAKHSKSKAQAKPHKKPAAKPATAAKKSATAKAPAAPPRVLRQAPPPPPPPPLATPKPPAADAVLIFERGMAELQRHNYPAAKTAFQSLIDKFPSEGFLTDRARVYPQLADREIQRRPASSGSVEEAPHRRDRRAQQQRRGRSRPSREARSG